MRLALAGESLPLWVTAECQTAGRGREGRAWVSTPGNLHASLALLSAANAAEERPNTTLVQKSKATAVSSSTASKASKVQSPTPTSDASTVRAGTRQGVPAAGQAAPAPERAREGCHGKDVDA